MPFLGSTCVDHGQASGDPSAQCCPGYQKWYYDANTGTAYSGFMCWTATCANSGQWAGPNGNGNNCCSPLQNVSGKCGTPGGTPGGSTTGGGGIPLPLPTVCAGTLICSIPDMYLYAGAGLLVLMMVMGSKKKGA